jgi:chemotaxis response regulator CheB
MQHQFEMAMSLHWFDFPIVGIGASAGGIEALEGFFRGLPSEPGLAVVIVTHLPPDRESLLHEVVRHLTTMSVTTVADETELKPDCVFVLTNSAILTVKQRRLIVRQNGSRRERKPIDIFSSLAADVGELAVGVVRNARHQGDQGARRPDLRPGRRRFWPRPSGNARQCHRNWFR